MQQYARSLTDELLRLIESMLSRQESWVHLLGSCYEEILLQSLRRLGKTIRDLLAPVRARIMMQIHHKVDANQSQT